MSPDLKTRSTLPEKMDQNGVPELEIRQALHELALINRYLGGYSPVLRALERLPLPTDRPCSIMDLGCGGGDTLQAIARWAKRSERDVILTGIDRNPLMTRYAAAQCKAFPNIQFQTLSVFDDKLLEQPVDVTTCSLFCHHFEETELIALLHRMMELSTVGVVINDLHRHWMAYKCISLLTRLFSKTYLVRYDGPLSVARAFTRADWEHILQAAGIRHYSIRWKWAWRWEVMLYKNPGS